MSISEEQVDKYLEARETAAWNKMKDKLTSGLPSQFEGMIKSAFLIGYGLGSIEEEQIIKYISKQDPIQFYEWLKE